MRVLVLLASYNGEKYISDQLASILEQKEVIVDLIISDDNSKDATVAIINQFIAKNYNIEIIRNEFSSGSAANNFIGLLKAITNFSDYDFVAFADQDDIWLPQKLNAAVNLLTKNKAQLYCSNLTKWDTSTGLYSLLKKDYPQKEFDFLFEGGSAGCTYVFTKEFAELLQLFLKKVDVSQWQGFSHDWFIYFFARKKNHKVVIDSNSFIYYRLHDNNVHGHLNKLSLVTIKEKFSQVLNGYYQNHVTNYIKYLEQGSDEYRIYKDFMGNYYQRNKIIWKYNTKLMRDKKKFLIFAILNLLRFK